MSGPANSLLQPAGGARNALAPQQVRDAIERREADGPLAIGPSGRRPLAALHDLHAALAHETRFEALASVLPDLPEAEDNWYIATRIAEEARIDDEVGRAVAFLLGEHNTSGATRSPFAIALVLATAAAFAVPEHGALNTSPTHVVAPGRRLAKACDEAFRVFLDAQRQLTVDLFAGAKYVSLLRGERRKHPVAGAVISLDLRTLSSWTTSPDAAWDDGRA
jgi:hypothetical protein